MTVKWTVALRIGVEHLDEQHRQIFAMADSLLQVSPDEENRAKIADAVEFLGRYVVQHFADEERVMTESDYPHLAEHGRLHEGFHAEFVALKERYERGGATGDLLLAVQRLVVDWLFDHVGQEDRAFGAYLQARAQPLPLAV